MAEHNPFHTPGAHVEVQEPELTGKVPLEIVEVMSQTKPWLIFFAILGILWTGLGMIGGLGMFASSFMSSNEEAFEKMPWMMPLLGAFYLIFAGSAIFPTVYLFKTSGAIGMLVANQEMSALQSAVDKQKKFWFASGLMTIGAIVLYMFAMIAMFAMMVPNLD